MLEQHQRPFSIKIFVPDGDPDGLRVVEKSNWTGVGIVFRRTNYKQAANRDEFLKTGVYILVGASEESSLPTVYIGEGDPVKARLDSHYSKKDFWDWAVFFVTKDSSLNKAHVKHLESRLLELAGDAKQCKLDNTQTSLPPSLSEAEIADVESFLLDILNVFPLLGLSVFEKTETSVKPRDLLYIKAKGVAAKGYEDAKGFVVMQGSQMVVEATPSLNQHYLSIRKDLIDQGIVVYQGQHYVFTQNQVFSAPSKAGAVITGGPTNGRTAWKTKEGTTLKEIQEASIVKEADDE
ncbi:GIY-YIG nuclease family protein [Gimesia benthica]|uniref:GIY-YIG nuclease family protein n=1 Tax=Gimesia benthica TaxID=2608982 RepID=A0A6I6AEH1_9PLAN|nr:GIY-YIG nuclease family protein [Gimesia benthica]QGQ23940.1 GIY-YIG nuclease family protein [Gimesia benthica]